uniref:Candidate secreted effector n=1 Tax=Meloidogyne incognita TaxID=6306 RepID=A0A914NK94_MELIC
MFNIFIRLLPRHSSTGLNYNVVSNAQLLSPEATTATNDSRGTCERHAGIASTIRQTDGQGR